VFTPDRVAVLALWRAGRRWCTLAATRREAVNDLHRLEPYTLHVYDISYFSGKMQAYLAYKGIDHRVHEIGWHELVERIAPQTGLAEVPVVECADGTILRDTTAMIEWFEQRYPRASVLPEDPAAAFFCRLLEDYADEGLWRPALYYRWAFPKDAELYARRFTEDFLAYPLTPAAVLRVTMRNRQRRVYLRGEGITSGNRADVERHYREELTDLEAIFRRRAFLFGDRPSLADFGYFASMFRHFGIDPTPSRIMRNEAPAVYEWVARLWNARAERVGSGGWAATAGGLPDGVEPLLARAGRRYLPALYANARAVADARTSYSVTLEGKEYAGLRAVPFQAWRRVALQRELARLPPAAAAAVRSVLARTDCLQWLERDGTLDSHYPEGDRLPLCTARRFTRAGRLWLRLVGTPHHIEAGGAPGTP
jgi:glutathione S-transferase